MAFDSDKMTVNKLIVLYILNEIEIAISRTQLTNIVLENNFIDYFSLQQCIPELEQSELIKQVEMQQKLCYTITENGCKTIGIFIKKIPAATKNAIDGFIKANKNSIKQDAQITADFVKNSENEYIVNLKVIENNMALIDLKLSVVSSKQAKFICEKWKNSSEKIYSQIMNTLIN